jgi:hypothetical protein
MENILSLSEEVLVQSIFIIRGARIMLDFDLAALYGLTTRVLKQQVRRNLERFPSDFMFQLTKNEWTELITKCDKFPENIKHYPLPPLAFTEQGVAMLSSVLRSKRAVLVNIAVMRAFVNLRQLIDANKDLIKRIDSLEEKYDHKFKLVFEAIKELVREENKPREKIGYKIPGPENK